MLSTRLVSNGARSGTRSCGLRKRCERQLDGFGIQQTCRRGTRRPGAARTCRCDRRRDWRELARQAWPDAAVGLQAHQRLGQVVDDARDGGIGLPGRVQRVGIEVDAPSACRACAATSGGRDGRRAAVPAWVAGRATARRQLSWHAAPSVGDASPRRTAAAPRAAFIGAIVDFVCSDARPHVVRENLGRARRARHARRAHAAVYRPAPGPRSDVAAGVRRLAADRSQGAPARSDHRDDGPQHADLAAVAAGHRRRSPKNSSTRSNATAKSSAFASRTASARCRASCTSSARSSG